MGPTPHRPASLTPSPIAGGVGLVRVGCEGARGGAWRPGGPAFARLNL